MPEGYQAKAPTIDSSGVGMMGISLVRIRSCPTTYNCDLYVLLALLVEQNNWQLVSECNMDHRFIGS